MQKRVASQVGLEEEIMAKVDEQYNNLKSIIDEQKDSAKNIIRNLESVQNYRPSPSELHDWDLGGFEYILETGWQDDAEHEIES